ncbi:FMN-binding protein [Emcibacter nanhaiensis]|uniref:FMN-binding protein n=1 Tax=Emcibacter nanhaiensis TaxID=1505037 RepID=A0A501PAW3_9PROT|nr:FMN-binding protein [Emcibacter nanhaiensis]TPD57493.1 FMN-binding protein [Emcibacter nanhaiensis]
MSFKQQLLLVPAATVLTVAPSFSAEYLTLQQAQQAAFPAADSFVSTELTLTKDQKKQIKKASGVRQRWDVQKVWRAEKAGEFLGWFIVDDVVGKHEFITYGAALTPDGAVKSIDIMIYQESYGGQVREEDWQKNFDGKTSDSRLKLGDDIPNIAGATLSCRNVTDGVKRLLAIHDLFLTSDRTS